MKNTFYFMVVHFFLFKSNARNNTKFIMVLQIDMSPITGKKKNEHSLIRLLKFINHNNYYIIL